MQYITSLDYILLPVYLFIFYVIIKRRSLLYTDLELRKFFFIAFALRMAGSVMYAMLVQYYYGYGDSFTFFYGSNFLTDQIAKDPGNLKYLFAPAKEVEQFYNQEVGDINYLGYFGIGSALFVMKISAILSYLAFNKFLIVSLFFGLFSFLGQWKLFLVFNDITKGANQKILAYAVLFTPSIWFWGSGLMKDSICLGGLGFIISILYNLFIRKKGSFKDILLLLLLIYIVYNIKSYVILIFLVGVAAMLFATLIQSFKNIILRAFFILGFIVISIFLMFALNFNEQLQQLVEESKQQISGFQNNYNAVNSEDERSLAGRAIKEIDFSLTGIILHSPVAIVNCLYRPFLWESRKVIILFTAFESTLMLLALLYLLFKTRVVGFLKLVFTDKYILFSLIVSISFALIIGFTTYNFGTMIRYKIILMPFYYFMLVRVYSYLNIQKASNPLN